MLPQRLRNVGNVKATFSTLLNVASKIGASRIAPLSRPMPFNASSELVSRQDTEQIELR